jgi:hypothetical protein
MSTDKPMAGTLFRHYEVRSRQATAATGTDKPMTADTLMQRNEVRGRRTMGAAGGDRR